MHFESARELRDLLVVDAERFYAARSLTVDTPPSPPLAFGIAAGRREGDYFVAVRVLEADEAAVRFVDVVTERVGEELDVRRTGPIRAFAHEAPLLTERNRPLVVGCSVGHLSVTAGTLGGFVRVVLDDGTVADGILSNNHVLANENAAERGDVILQPAPYDKGTTADRIGRLWTYVPLSAERNRVDAAVAVLDEAISYTLPDAGEPGFFEGVFDGVVELGTPVEKIGRSTGHTIGRVTAVELVSVRVQYGGLGTLVFDGQIEIEGGGDDAFSAGGDSGSVIYGSTDRAGYGLLFAGSTRGGSNGEGLTFANSLAEALAGVAATLAVREKESSDDAAGEGACGPGEARGTSSGHR